MARWSSFGKPSARRCSPKWCTSRRANWCRFDNASPLEKIRLVRRQAKEKVFVTNCLRALRQVSPGGSIRDIAFVVLVGGSSLDFEIPQLITEALSHYGVVAGQGNIRGTEGPRNAVATGLLLAGQAN
ncbi:diol dehydratase reactivase ATPase-like domain-containing protein [Klebsiella pneumoniae]